MPTITEAEPNDTYAIFWSRYNMEGEVRGRKEVEGLGALADFIQDSVEHKRTIRIIRNLTRGTVSS